MVLLDQMILLLLLFFILIVSSSGDLRQRVSVDALARR